MDAIYAHVLIEHGNDRYPPGHVLPDDLPGIDELLAIGSAGVEPPVLTAGGGTQVRRFDGDWEHDQIASGEAAPAEIFDAGEANA